jgi:DNA-binding beta-propeller fold protein YncE
LTMVGPATVTGGSPRSVAFSPGGGLLATANYGDNTVSVFSVSPGGALTAVGSPIQIGTGSDPGSVAFSPDGRLLATANYGDNTVSVFSVSAGGLLAPVGSATATGLNPVSVAFSADGRLLATANDGESTVSVFSVSPRGMLIPVGSALATGQNPYSVAFSPIGGLLATANFTDDSVSMFAGGEPAAQIIAPADQQTYTQNQNITTSFACSAPAGSGAISSCTDSNGATSPSGTLDTATLGAHAYTVTATSNDTLATSTTIHYTVASAPPPTTSTSTTATSTTTATTTPTIPPAPPMAPRITQISTTTTTVVWCHGADCAYPSTRLRFSLNRAATVRLVLRTRRQGHFQRVATTILHGHQGSNQDRLAGRWRGHLFPAGPVQILVQIQRDQHWTTSKMIRLTVRHTHQPG